MGSLRNKHVDLQPITVASIWIGWTSLNLLWCCITRFYSNVKSGNLRPRPHFSCSCRDPPKRRDRAAAHLCATLPSAGDDNMKWQCVNRLFPYAITPAGSMCRMRRSNFPNLFGTFYFEKPLRGIESKTALAGLPSLSFRTLPWWPKFGWSKFDTHQKISLWCEPQVIWRTLRSEYVSLQRNQSELR